jgi:hypothetical protein
MQATDVTTASRIETRQEGLILFLGERRVLIPWEKCSPKLAKATETQRFTAELSPGGYGIHWPLLDEDLSVAGLLRNL